MSDGEMSIISKSLEDKEVQNIRHFSVVCCTEKAISMYNVEPSASVLQQLHIIRYSLTRNVRNILRVRSVESVREPKQGAFHNKI